MRSLLLVLTIALPGPAAALELCEELWFARNLLFHKAGYCFGSTLGQAVFGNLNCVGKDISLSAKDKAFVARVRAEEAAFACEVDSSASTIPVSLTEARKRLTELPFPSEFESACVGWKGAPLTLYGGFAPDAPVMATVPRGANLLFQYNDVDGWHFVELLQDGEITALGWAALRFDENSCEMMAG